MFKVTIKSEEEVVIDVDKFVAATDKIDARLSKLSSIEDWDGPEISKNSIEDARVFLYNACLFSITHNIPWKHPLIAPTYQGTIQCDWDRNGDDNAVIMEFMATDHKIGMLELIDKQAFEEDDVTFADATKAVYFYLKWAEPRY